MNALAGEILRQARLAGATAAATVELGPAPSFHRFEDWLGRGWHGDMAYLARQTEDRRDPRRLLPGARSAVVVAVNVRIPPAPAGISAQVSAYARGQDYHRVTAQVLGQLAERLHAAAPVSVKSLACVDTAPLLERELAWRAGLGWIGRNRCLIAPAAGSFTVLGTLLTTLPLPGGPPPAESRCGTCRLCVAACPTGALDPELGIDARRCLSYLTIEHRGLIPREYHPFLGQTLFGCDRCQDVCPWNRGAAGAALPAFAPRPWPAAEQLLPLTGAVFRAWFRGTALERARRDGLTRNLLIHLSVRGHRAVPELLGQLGDDPSPVIAGTVDQLRSTAAA